MEKSEIINLVNDALASGRQRERAFTRLYSIYNAPVKSQVAYMLKRSTSDPTVDDLVQATFVKVFLKIRDYNAKWYFAIWIKCICKRTVIDYFRSQKHERGFIDIDTCKSSSRFISRDNPTSRLYCSDELRMFEYYLLKLNPFHRNIMQMRFDGASYDEISKRLNVKVSTLSAIISRCRQDMKRKFL